MSFVSAIIIDAGLFIVILIALSILYEKQKGGILPFIAMILATVFFIQLSPGSLTAFSPTEIVLTKITDFGATRGVGIFGVLLALLGIMLSWKEKDRHAIVYLGLICLFLASLIRPSLIVFIDLMLAYYAGSALFLLWRSAWESETLKYYVLILVICGLIFSSGSYIRSLSQAPPTYGETKSMQWLSAREGKVLSYYRYGHFIRTLSGNEVYTDPTYYETSRDKTKIRQSQEIFQSRSYENITQFFIRNNITYLWVNPQMTEGLIWQDEDQGMRLIMHNSREFSRPYNYLGVEIWKFSP